MCARFDNSKKKKKKKKKKNENGLSLLNYMLILETLLDELANRVDSDQTPLLGRLIWV